MIEARATVTAEVPLPVLAHRRHRRCRVGGRRRTWPGPWWVIFVQKNVVYDDDITPTSLLSLLFFFVRQRLQLASIASTLRRAGGWRCTVALSLEGREERRGRLCPTNSNSSLRSSTFPPLNDAKSWLLCFPPSFHFSCIRGILRTLKEPAYRDMDGLEVRKGRCQ